jgi:hypothetical protein
MPLQARLVLVLWGPSKPMPSFRMRSFSPFFCFIVIFSSLLAGGVLFVYQPKLEPDLIGFHKCIRLHPARYCRITFLGER